MDGSDYKDRSSSTPTKISPTLINDENERSYEENDPNLRNETKPTSNSKAILQKKKILAENNHQSQKTPSQSQISEFDENEHHSDLAADSDSKPYDPVTNYLSPRPKFLRYQPDRRHEILLRKESENSSVSANSSSASRKDFVDGNALVNELDAPIDNLKQEDDEFDESDDEFEEIDEVRRWGLKGLFKFFLVLVGLVFCTSYLSSMNSISPSFSAQAVRSLEDNYYFIQHNVNEFVKSFQDSSGIVEPPSEGLQILDAEKNQQVDESDEVVEQIIQSGEIEENNGESDELTKALEQPAAEIDPVFDNKMPKIEGTGQSEAIEQPPAEIDQVSDNKVVKSEEICEIGQVCDDRMAKNEDNGDSQMVVEQPAVEIDQICDNKMAKSEETGEKMAVEKFESLQESQVESIPDEIWNNEALVEPIEVFHSVETDQDVKMEPIQVVNSLETVQADETGQDRTEILNPESVPSLIKLVASEFYLKLAVIGAFTFCTILVSLVFGFRFMKKKRVQKDYSSKIFLKPCVKSVTTTEDKKKNILEDYFPVAAQSIEVPVTGPGAQSSIELNFKSTLPHGEEDKENYNNSDFLAKPQPMVNLPEKEDSIESYKSHALAVELLGEFAIGEVSSSMRMKNKTVESEVDSHHSVSVEKAQSASYRSQPAVSESFNIVSPPSHGSYTAEKRTSKKKKENRDLEVTGITTTPLRRSNRLQNRAIVSP